MNTTLYSLEKKDGVVAVIVFSAAMALYVSTLSQGLMPADGGEFQTLVYTLGMTHPTGYPVYILLGHLFTLLPVGEPAWRVNLFSAFLGGLTVAMVYLSICILTRWRLAAVIGALTLAITPLFWFFSIITELYIPASAFLAGILLCLLIWTQTQNRKFLFIAGLLGGLSLGVHNLIALTAPAIFIWLLLTDRSRKVWFSAIGGALLGLALTASGFLFLDLHDPPSSYYNATVRYALSNWNMTVTDFDSPAKRLWFIITAQQFRDRILSEPSTLIVEHARTYIDLVASIFSPFLLILILSGVLALFFRRWREALLYLLGWGIQTLFLLNYKVDDFIVYSVPGFIFLVLWAGVGLGTLMDGIEGALKKTTHARMYIFVAFILLGAGILGDIALHWSNQAVASEHGTGTSTVNATTPGGISARIHDPKYLHVAAESLVNALEDNAIIFTSWDMLYPYYFVAHVEQGRTGMVFHQIDWDSGKDTLAESTIVYIRESLPRPIYFQAIPPDSAMRRLEFIRVQKGGFWLYQVTKVK